MYFFENDVGCHLVYEDDAYSLINTVYALSFTQVSIHEFFLVIDSEVH
jgi:hypothetical protein